MPTYSTTEMPLNPNDFPDQGGVATLDPSSFPDQVQGSALDPSSFPDQGGTSDTPETDKALRDAVPQTLSPEEEQAAVAQVGKEHPILSNAAAAAGELITGMVPRTPYQYAAQIFPPLAAYEQTKAITSGDVSSIPLVGRVPEIIKAEQTPAFSKERFATAARTLMDVGILAGAGAPRARVGEVPTEGEINAIQPSNAQMETRGITQRFEARPEGEIPPASYSDYAQRETQGAVAGRELPQEPVVGEPPQAAQEPITNIKDWIGEGTIGANLNNAGNPLKLYHGTRTEFETFRPSEGGAVGPGIYLSKEPKLASVFAGEREGARVLQVYARGKYLKIPYGEMHNAAEWNAKARAEGYNGIDTGLGELVVFDPKDIVSSTGKQPVPEPVAPTTAAPEGTGIANKYLAEVYGDEAPVATTGKGPGAWKNEGISRLDNYQKSGDARNDPYAVLTNLRQGKVPMNQVPSDVSLLRAEHQRLVEDARNAEGTSEYAAKSQAALNMATAIKEVAHGPASDVFRALQEYDKPRYDNVTDFDQALRERTGFESTPQQKVQFKKIADDVATTRNGAEKEIVKVQRQLSKQPKMSFEDAYKRVHDQIAVLTKDCIL